MVNKLLICICVLRSLADFWFWLILIFNELFQIWDWHWDNIVHIVVFCNLYCLEFSKNSSKIKINLNIYVQTSLWHLKRFYSGLGWEGLGYLNLFFSSLSGGVFLIVKRWVSIFYAVHRSCIKIFGGIMSFCHMKIKKP